MGLNIGILESSRSVAPSISYLLDLYPSAAAAYSLRKLRTAYSGYAIKVRRSSDNTTQNIGFASTGGLDLTALTTFVGASNGFVDTWYDQSGNVRDVTQGTAANQGQIVSSGSVITQNGKPCITFNGTSTGYLEIQAFFNFMPMTVLSLQKSNKVTGTQNIFRVGSTIVYLHRYENATIRDYANGGSFDASTVIVPTNRLFTESYYTTTSLAQYVNAVAGTVDSSGSGASAGGAIAIGYTPGFSEWFDGNIQEIIIYTTNQTSNRTGIESNFNTYYTIY